MAGFMEKSNGDDSAPAVFPAAGAPIGADSGIRQRPAFTQASLDDSRRSRLQHFAGLKRYRNRSG